jgi:hypothetical protein
MVQRGVLRGDVSRGLLSTAVQLAGVVATVSGQAMNGTTTVSPDAQASPFETYVSHPLCRWPVRCSKHTCSVFLHLFTPRTVTLATSGRVSLQCH